MTWNILNLKIERWQINANGLAMFSADQKTRNFINLNTLEMKKEDSKLLQNEALNIADVSGSICSMKKAMDNFKKELEIANKENPDDLVIKGANWGYNKAIEQFHNRFARYYR